MSDYSSDAGSEEKEEITIASDTVVNKYKIAADITNKALEKVISAAIADANTLDLCKLGDDVVVKETQLLFKKQKQMKKGIAWPTCISVNNTICHYSPLESTTEPLLLKIGDMVKVEIGAHIDGFPAFGAHTIVVGATKENPCTGKSADVIWAAYQAAEAAIRMLKPGTVNREITKIIQKTTEVYDCQPIQNMASYNIEKDIVEGEKSILQNPTDQLTNRMVKNKDESPTGQENKEASNALMGEKCDIEVNDVWAIDILASTGDGKVNASDVKTSLFRRDPHNNYQLKMKTSRETLSKAQEVHGCMTFSLRAFENETRTRLGLKECINHEVVTQYPVMVEKSTELVAQFKYTVLVLASGILRITPNLPFDSEAYKTDKVIQDQELKNLLATSISKKSAKRKKKKAKQAASATLAEATA